MALLPHYTQVWDTLQKCHLMHTVTGHMRHFYPSQIRVRDTRQQYERIHGSWVFSPIATLQSSILHSIRVWSTEEQCHAMHMAHGHGAA